MSQNKMKHVRIIDAISKAIILMALTATLSGCATDSWFDPSVVGRWESTAAVAPIIDRLDVIEPAARDFVQTTSVTPGDLIPDIQAYTIGPADTLLIEIFELFDAGVPYVFNRIVDDTGYISVPLIGQLYLAGFTEIECQRLIGARLTPSILLDPQVSVIARNKTQNRFSVSGPAGAGLIDIPHPRFRLTDALAAYGSSPFGADYIYVIRQIPLDESMIRGTSLRKPAVTEPAEESMPTLDDENPSEGAAGAVDLGSLIDELTTTGLGNAAASIEAGGEAEVRQQQPALQIPKPGEGGAGEAPAQWVYLDGQWIRVAIDPTLAGREDEGPTDLVTELDISKLVTQRVIKIPVRPLMEGVAAYNVIIRPNDMIRIPAPEVGIIYLQGQVARPGSFDLPLTGKQTLIRAIAGAGGLAPLAIPERVDIIRILPNNRQATVRVNFRAITEMIEPDIYLKPGDVINVGTTWYAAPLAVFRNGFRMSYGFGFLLDRNFADDVYGSQNNNNNN